MELINLCIATCAMLCYYSLNAMAISFKRLRLFRSLPYFQLKLFDWGNMETPQANVGARRFWVAAVNEQFKWTMWLHIALLNDLLCCAAFLATNGTICCSTIMTLYWRALMKSTHTITIKCSNISWYRDFEMLKYSWLLV